MGANAGARAFAANADDDVVAAAAAGRAAEFGNNIYGGDSTKEIGVTNLSVALMFVEHSYNEVADRMPDFVRLCERALDARPAKT